MPNTPGRGTDRPSRLARGAELSGTSGKLCPADQATGMLPDTSLISVDPT
jgi:malonate decarboxylase alpha subunit